MKSQMQPVPAPPQPPPQQQQQPMGEEQRPALEQFSVEECRKEGSGSPSNKWLGTKGLLHLLQVSIGIVNMAISL